MCLQDIVKEPFLDNVQNNDNQKAQETSLFKAIEAGDFEAVRKLINEGVSLACKGGEWQEEPLSFAIHQYFNAFNITDYSYEAFRARELTAPFSDENKKYQDIVVLIQQHLNKVDISQGVILQKFLRFLSVIYHDDPSPFETAIVKDLYSIKEGVCSGISAIFSDSASQDKEKQFIEDLKTISKWDGEKESLMSSTDLFKTIRTMYDNVIFAAFMNSMSILNKNVTQEDGKENGPLKTEEGIAATQKEWGTLLNLISDRSVTRKKEFEVIFSYTSSELTDAINKVALEGKSVRVSFLGHTTELHKKNGKFMYYDSNSPDEPYFADSAEEVFKQIQSSIIHFEKNKELTADSLMGIEMQVFNFNNSPPGDYPDLTNFIGDYIRKRKDSFSINECTFSSNTNPLCTAIGEDSIENVQALLSAGADPNLAMLLSSVSTRSNQLAIYQLLLDHGLDPNMQVPNWQNNPVPVYDDLKYLTPQLYQLFDEKAKLSASSNSMTLTPLQALYTMDSTLFSKAYEKALNEGKLNSSDIITLQKTLKLIMNFHQNQYQPSETILAEHQKMDTLLASADKSLTKKSELTNPKVYIPLVEKNINQGKIIPTAQAAESILENKNEDTAKKTNKPQSN